MGGKYGEGYRCATHMTKVFVKTTILFLQCGYILYLPGDCPGNIGLSTVRS